MTARVFLEQFQTTRGVKLRKRGKRLHVRGTLSAQDQILVGMHRKELLSALNGQDVELRPALKQIEYLAAGLIQMDTGAWTHPLGDEHAAAILTGLITFEDAKAQQQQDERVFQQMGTRVQRSKS